MFNLTTIYVVFHRWLSIQGWIAACAEWCASTVGIQTQGYGSCFGGAVVLANDVIGIRMWFFNDTIVSNQEAFNIAEMRLGDPPQICRPLCLSCQESLHRITANLIVQLLQCIEKHSNEFIR